MMKPQMLSDSNKPRQYWNIKHQITLKQAKQQLNTNSVEHENVK